MRPLTRTALWLLMAAGPALAAASTDASAPLPRIVVAFANERLVPPERPAAATGAPATASGRAHSGRRTALPLTTPCTR